MLFSRAGTAALLSIAAISCASSSRSATVTPQGGEAPPPVAQTTPVEAPAFEPAPPLPEPPQGAACVVHGRGHAIVRTLEDPTITVGVSGSVTAHLVPGPLSAVFVTVDLGGIEVAGRVAVERLDLSTDDELVIDGYGVLRGSLSTLHSDGVVAVSVEDTGLVLEPRWAALSDGKVKGRNLEANVHVACDALRLGVDAGARPLPIESLGTATGRGTKPIELSKDPGGVALVDVDPSVTFDTVILEERGPNIRVYMRHSRFDAAEWGVVGWAKKKRFVTTFWRDEPEPTQAQREEQEGMARILSSEDESPPSTMGYEPIDAHQEFDCPNPIVVWAASSEGTVVVGRSTPNARLFVYEAQGDFAPVDTTVGLAPLGLRVRKTDLEQCTLRVDEK